MRVKMLTVECGPDGNFQPGDEREVSDEHGRQLIAGRNAADITPRHREEAVPVPRETALSPSAPKRKTGKVR